MVTRTTTDPVVEIVASLLFEIDAINLAHVVNRRDPVRWVDQWPDVQDVYMARANALLSSRESP